MARYEHLRLVRLPEQMERRKHGGGRAVERDAPAHARALQAQLDVAIETQVRRRRPRVVDPSLILRVRMAGGLQEPEWEKLGLTVLSTDPDRTLVLFADNDELQQFRARLTAFGRGVPPGQKGPQYAAFIGGIEQIGAIQPADRIGSRLKDDGVVKPDDFDRAATYVLDLELWELGARPLRTRKLSEVRAYVEALHGEVLDEYVGPAIAMLRLRITGSVAISLLNIEDVASLDLPPQPDVSGEAVLDLALGDVPAPEPLDDQAPLIGVIDSGLNDHPLIADIIVGRIGVPEALGTADAWGHGTRVAGVAAFGDLDGQLRAGVLHRFARLCSARVVNDRGAFDERRLVPKQMREAITRLNREFGCRIFVSALADIKLIFAGRKVGQWAATLDELARELNVLIIVAAGNGQPPQGLEVERAVLDYPHYLLTPSNRLYEPAGALNVVTVGAVAHGTGLPPNLADDLQVRPITLAGDPSPFSRVGPGVGGSVKPDVVDTGGTMLVDGLTGRLRDGERTPQAGVVTLHHRPFERLFTSRSGTSYAAPLVAAKAAQVLSRFPGASANLLRALLLGAATRPEQGASRMHPFGGDAVCRVLGHGRVDMERAAFSDDDRVVLYVEDQLAVDHFAIFEVPMPEQFQDGGRRTIQVTLAYDPPVRHARLDYAGLGMSFRLHRGCPPETLFEFYRKRNLAEGHHPDIPGRFCCDLEPGPTERECSSVQIARKTFARSTAQYGDPYYLVVRCEGGWAAETVVSQRFALVVELSHEARTRLYDRLRLRLHAALGA
jgi:hypothetical protein